MTNQRHAVVLSGGGVTGIAWHIGMLKGLRDAGADLTTVDRIIGTSAGAIVGTRVAAGHALDTLYAGQLGAREESQRTAPSAWLGRWAKNLLTRPIYARLPKVKRAWGALEWMTPERAAAFGEWALRSLTMTEPLWLWQIGRMLRVEAWPERELLLCAVDALNGERVLWDRDAGALIERAVAASAALPTVAPPVGILGRRYIDGGFASVSNADVARGCAGVVILVAEELGERGLPGLMRRQLDAEIAGLRAAGSQVVALVADAASRRAMGAEHRNPLRKAPAARAGYRQGMTQSERVCRLLAESSAAASA